MKSEGRTGGKKTYPLSRLHLLPLDVSDHKNNINMNELKYLAIFSILLLSNLLIAQNYGCGAVALPAEVSFLDGELPIPSNPPNPISDDFPIVVYVIDSTNSNGTPITQNEILTELGIVNSNFNDAFVNFPLLTFEQFSDDNLCVHIKNTPQRYLYPYYPNAINIYVVDTVKSGSSILNGYSSFPVTASPGNSYADDRIFISSEAITNGTTLTHELGHFFGLFHTHNDTNCPTACLSDNCNLPISDLNDPNLCNQNGDRCCDTAVDPYFSPYDTQNCSEQSGCNNVHFPNVDFINLMSYYQSCRDTFTEDQEDRIFHYSNNGREYISNNNQSQLLTLLSPSYGTFESFDRRDMHWVLGDNIDVWVDLKYRELNGSWIDIETHTASNIGYNINGPNFTPLFYGSGTIQYEYKVEYSSNNLIYDIGYPITVRSVFDNPSIDQNLSLDLSCTNCIGGTTETISWSLPLSVPINLAYTTNGGISWDPIALNIPNIESHQWEIPSCINTDYLSIGIQYESSPGIYTFDVIEGFESIEEPAIDLDNGLVAYYPFNENADDESGNGNNLSIVGANFSSDRFGETNKSISLDGIDDYLFIDDTIIDDNVFSYCLWFRMNSNSNGKKVLFNQGSSPGNSQTTPTFEFSNFPSSDLRFFTYNGTSSDLYSSNIGWSTDKWYHVAVTSDGSNRKFYVNGSLNNEVNGQNDFGQILDYFYIGANPAYNDGYVDGKIDDFRIYSRALTCNEIQELFHDNCWEETVDLQDGLVAYYPFNGNANDESGNNLNGIVDGATLTYDRFGNINSAFDFNGISNKINVSNMFVNGVSPHDPLSLSFWLKTSSTKSDNTVLTYYTSCSGGTDSDYFATIIYNSSNNSNFQFFHVKSGSLQIDRSLVANGEWHHIAIIHDGFKGELYLDNVLVDESNDDLTVNSVPNNLDFVIGYSHTYSCGVNAYFAGSMDDISVYGRAINCNEIDSLYNQGCVLNQVINNLVIDIDTTFYARQQIDLENITVNSPYELTLKTPNVQLYNNCEIAPGAKITVLNEDGCISN